MFEWCSEIKLISMVKRFEMIIVRMMVGMMFMLSSLNIYIVVYDLILRNVVWLNDR